MSQTLVSSNYLFYDSGSELREFTCKDSADSKEDMSPNSGFSVEGDEILHTQHQRKLLTNISTIIHNGIDILVS